MTRPTVLGAGSWGTALALVLARRGLPVKLWVHNPDHAAQLARTRFNLPYLPGFQLPENIHVSGSLLESVHRADVVVFATPTTAIRGIASSISSNLASDACLVSASKGIEEYSLQTITQVLHHCCGTDRLVVLSGPSFAVEVARELPTAVVAASALPQLASGVQGLFSGSRFRVYTSYDVAGVEFGGAMKNVIAIAAGVCHGMQLGQNAIAALVTRGLAEMSRLAVVLGAQAQTLAGLAGLGDLMLTCNGDLSRNRQVGIQLASGKTVEAITAGMKTVAEGLLTTNSIVALGRRENVSLPIAEQMHSTLHGGCSPQDAIRFLMERSLKEE